MKHRNAILVSTCIVGLGLWSSPLFAADIVAPSYEPESGWTFTVAPYFWAAAMDGTVGQFGLPDIEVDASFSDIFKNLDFGAMGVVEARNGSFGVLGDVMYVKLSGDKGLSAHDVDADVKLTSETFSALLAGEYRLIESEGGSLDILAGGRYWAVTTDVDLSGALNASANDRQDWIDPMVGLKGRANLSPDFFLTGWGMIGGFGVASDFAWDAFGGIGYEISDTVSVIAGYRALSVDYQNDDFKFDVTEHGPILGATFSF